MAPTYHTGGQGARKAWGGGREDPEWGLHRAPLVATGGRGTSWGRSGLAEPAGSQEEADPMNGELSVEGKRNKEGTSRGGGGGIETRWVQGIWGAGEHL